MEAGGVGISERQLEVCCLLGGNEYMYAVVHRESCCNIGIKNSRIPFTAA